MPTSSQTGLPVQNVIVGYVFSISANFWRLLCIFVYIIFMALTVVYLLILRLWVYIWLLLKPVESLVALMGHWGQNFSSAPDAPVNALCNFHKIVISGDLAKRNSTIRNWSIDILVRVVIFWKLLNWNTLIAVFCQMLLACIVKSSLRKKYCIRMNPC